jgi:hypothetical protein
MFSFRGQTYCRFIIDRASGAAGKQKITPKRKEYNKRTKHVMIKVKINNKRITGSDLTTTISPHHIFNISREFLLLSKDAKPVTGSPYTTSRVTTVAIAVS